MRAGESDLNALNSRDWTGAEVEHVPRPAMTVHSVRLPADLANWVDAEADRQGIAPSAVIRNLVERAARPTAEGETAVVHVDDLRRKLLCAVEQAISPAA